MIWTFKQERNCCTISVCYSGCEMTPRRNSFARRQPPIQPVLDASFLLMQRSGTHALFVKLTGSHLPALPVLLRSLLYGVRQKKSSINQYFFIDSGNYFLARQKTRNTRSACGPSPPAARHPARNAARTIVNSTASASSYSCRSRNSENAASELLSIIQLSLQIPRYFLIF